MAVITVDLGGTRIKFGIIRNGNILAAGKMQARPDGNTGDNLGAVSSSIRALMSEHAIPMSEITGIGLSFPSIVNCDTNRVISKYVKYNDAHEFDFNSWAEQEWHLPVCVENDARAALIGEWQHGAAKGFSSVGFIILGTGVGTAVIMDGRLLRGKHFLAGNLGGHTSVNLHAGPCNCGYFGCLETEASTWALAAKAKSNKSYASSSLSAIADIGFHEVFEHAEQGDVLATHLLNECLKGWGVCTVNMVHSFDPEVIVVGGGIMNRKESILPHLQGMIDNHAWIPPGSTKVIAAQQVEYAALLGMEYLLSKRYKIEM